MLYMKCPTCKNLLGNKEIPFEKRKEEVCNNPDLSKEEMDKEMTKILDDLGLDRYCCRMRLITITDQFSIIK